MATGLPDYFSRVFSEMLLQFTDLQDTPGSYAAQANKNVRVNQAESGLEFGGAYFDAGLDADKGEAGRKGRVWWATNSEKLYYDNGTDWVEILRSEAVSRLASLIDHAHDSLSSVTSDQHHAQSHSHASHTGIGESDHHDSLRLSAARAYCDHNQSITGGVVTKVELNKETYDIGGNFDPTTNYRYTVPAGQAGKYLIVGAICVLTTTDANRYALLILINNTQAFLSQNQASCENNIGVFCNDIQNLNAGDYVEMFTYSDIDFQLRGDSVRTFMTIHRLS